MERAAGGATIKTLWPAIRAVEQCVLPGLSNRFDVDLRE
jgi:hypothetical protein